MCQTDGVGCADGADRSGNTTKKNRYSVDAVIIGDGILDYGCRCQYSIWLVDGRVSKIGSVMPMVIRIAPDANLAGESVNGWSVFDG